MSENEIRHTSSTGGQKAGNDERYDLIPAEPLRKLARHYGVGAKKYDDDNWRKGYDWKLSFAAMMRHAWQFWAGEDIDEETGTPHIIAVAWHAFTLDEFAAIHPEFDSRLTTLDQRAVRKQPEDGPRQWGSLNEVPFDVRRVISRNGCHWKFWLPGEKDDNGKLITEVGQWLWSSASGDQYDKTGPFTEDIDETTESNDSVKLDGSENISITTPNGHTYTIDGTAQRKLDKIQALVNGLGYAGDKSNTGMDTLARMLQEIMDEGENQ